MNNLRIQPLKLTLETILENENNALAIGASRECRDTHRNAREQAVAFLGSRAIVLRNIAFTGV
jgi:hypothetical protein